MLEKQQLENLSTLQGIYVDALVKGLVPPINNDSEIFHLFSHGKSGTLFIEGQWKNAHQILCWLQAKEFTKNKSHLNIYGCNFAQGEKGRAAVEYLEAALNISVAASDDITGKNGDWDLEIGNAQQVITLSSYEHNLQSCDCNEYLYLNEINGAGRVHKFQINNDGSVTEVPGANGIPWYSSTNEVADDQMSSPHGLGIDINGNLYIGETYFGPVRKLDFLGNIVPSLDFEASIGGFNIGSIDNTIYLNNSIDGAVTRISAYDVCTGASKGYVELTNADGTDNDIVDWGFHIDENGTFYALSGRIEAGLNSLYVFNPTDADFTNNTSFVPVITSDPAATATDNPAPTIGDTFLPFGRLAGVTTDNSGNIYMVMENTWISPVSCNEIYKYNSNFEFVAKSTPDCTDGDGGYKGAIGIVYSETGNCLYVSSQSTVDDCVSRFDLNLNLLSAAVGPVASSGNAKGIAIAKECCPNPTTATIDKDVCYNGMDEFISLQEIVECEGIIVGGTWIETSSSTNIDFESCDNSVTVTGTGGCSTFTLQSNAGSPNPNCTSFNITVNVCSVSLTASASVSCISGVDTGTIDLTHDGTAPFIYTWTGPTAIANNVEDPTGLANGTYDVTITDNGGCMAIAQAVVNCSNPCSITLSQNTASCADNNDGTFTATYDLMLNWSDAPATGDITIALTGDGTLVTSTVSAATIAAGSTTTLTGALTVPADGTGNTTITATFDDDNTCMATASFKAPVPCVADVTPCASTANCIGGNVFEDFNCNGADDTEPGIQGVQIQVYDCNNNLVGTGYSDSDGDWQVCGLTDGTAYRIEHILPETVACWATPTHVGTDNGSDIQFLTVPACTQFSVSSPADYCNDSPDLVTSCFVFGDNSSAFSTEGAIVQFNRSDAGTIGAGNEGLNTYFANFDQTGTVGGLAVHAPSNLLFGGALAKRGADYGPGADGILGTRDDPGAIYIVDPNNVDLVNTLPTLNVPNAGPALPTPRGIDGTAFGPGGVYDGQSCADIASAPRPATTTTGWLYDACSYDIPGKQGLGDLQMDGTGNTLFAVNLYDRHLYSFDVSSSIAATIQASMQDLGPLFNDATTSDWPICANGEWRPFALEWYKGALYVGGICSGEYNDPTTTSIATANADLSVSVYRIDNPYTGTSAVSVLSGSLDYLRHAGAGGTSRLWQPWTAKFTDHLAYNQETGTQNAKVGSPMLTDIEFTADRTMILAFRDRTTEQNYTNSLGIYVDENGNYDANEVYDGGAGPVAGRFFSNGDLRRACATASGWEMEGSATCGPVGSSTIRSEFFAGDNAAGNFHREITQGFIALLPSTEEIAVIAMDADDDINSGGVRFIPTSGGTDRGEGYEIFEGNNIPYAAKGTGLGDVQYRCALAPLEIGNYVWCDSLENGIQDACERGISDILVQLYNADGNLIGQDTTVNGQYYFNQYNVDTTGIKVTIGAATPNTAWSGMDYSTQYYIVFGDGQFTTDEFTIGGEMYGITSMANVGSNDNIDSDVDGASLTSGSLGVRPDGLPFIDMMTSATGCGDHKYDMAVTCGDCFSIDSLLTDRMICSGDLVDSLAVTTTFSNPDSIAFVYFTSQQTDSIQIYTVGTGIDTVQVAASNDTVAITNIDFPANTGTSAVTYYVYAIAHPRPSDLTCRPNDEIIVTVNALPTATAAITSATCTSSSVNSDGTITISGFTSGERYDYVQASIYTGSATFASGSTLIPVGGEIVNNLVNPAMATDYTVRIFTSNECYVDRSVTLNPTICSCTNPILTALTDEAICVGGTFTSGNVTTSVTNGISVTYQWSDNNGIDNTGTGVISGQTSANLTALPTAAGSYSYLVTATNTTDGTCSATEVVNLTVHPLSTATAAITGATCTGSSVNSDGTIAISGFASSERYDYVQASTYTGSATFANGSTLIPADGEIVNNLMSSATATDYTVRIFTSNECFIDYTLTMPTEPFCCPIIENPSSQQTICEGDVIPFLQVEIDATNNIEFVYFTTPQTGNAMYTGGTSLEIVTPSSGNASTINVNFPSPATYYVYAILTPTPVDVTCRPNQEIVVEVNPLPNSSLVVSDLEVCEESEIEIMVMDTEIGVQYQLQDATDNSNVGSPVVGNGTVIVLSNPAMLAAGNYTYNVVAENGTTNCIVTLADQAVVIVNECDYPILPPRECPDFDPCHIISSDLYLGIQSTADAGNTGTSDDNDGVIFPNDLQPGGTINLPITIFNNTTNDAYLAGWIDWNGDGDFEDAGEQIADETYVYASNNGSFVDYIEVMIPSDAVQDALTYAVFRLSTDDVAIESVCSETGACAVDGEVEVYSFIVSCKPTICLPTSIRINK